MSNSNTERGRIINEKSTTTIVWKIRNYFSLPQKKDRCYDSPSFSFLNAKWYLQIHPNGESEHDSVGWIGLYLILQFSSTKSPHINYTLGIRNDDGSIYHDRNTEDQFKLNEYCYGFPIFIPNSEIRKNAHKILPNKTLTIFCILSDKNQEWPFSCESSQAYLEDQKDLDWWSPSSSRDSLKEETLEDNWTPKKKEDITSFFEDMKNLLVSERLCDVKICIKNEEFRAHKAILAARSPVFSAMFEHEMAEKNTNVVEISDSEPGVFKEFLHYLYTGEIKDNSETNACEVYILADKYDVKQLKETCVVAMRNGISVEHFCDVISLTLKYQESELLQQTTDFFVKNANSILQTVRWQRFMAEAPTVANELFLKALNQKS